MSGAVAKHNYYSDSYVTNPNLHIQPNPHYPEAAVLPEGDYESELNNTPPEETGDEFAIGGSEETGDLGAGRPLTVADQQQRLNDLMGLLARNDKIGGEDRRRLAESIRRLRGELEQISQVSSPTTRANMLAGIDAEISGVEAEILGQAPVGDEFGVEEETGAGGSAGLEDLETELKDFKNSLGRMTNLSEDERVEMESKIDRWLTEIRLAKDDPEKVDIEGIRGELGEMKSAAESSNEYSTGVKGLAEAFGMEPDQIKNKAKAKGINLDNVPMPPSLELINFLAELSPELKEKLEAVESAVNERQKSIETNLHTAKATNEANAKSTTDSDNTDIQAWQNLFDLKFFQDEKSQAVVSAKQAVLNELTPIFKALYPGQEVKAVEANGVSGWEKTQQEFLSTGQISIGGTAVDLFNDTDGTLLASTTPDAPPTFEIPGIAADGEGDGEWNPPKLQTYSDGQPEVNRYGGGG